MSAGAARREDGPAPIPGVTAALVTLFRDDLSVDYEATAALAGRLIEEGVDGVLVAGTTGEGRWLDARERVTLCAAVRRAVGDRAPVVAGVFGASGTEAAGEVEAALGAGADGVVALSPEHEPAALFYRALAEASGDAGFVLAYHLPSERPPGLRTDEVPGLAVAGVKDASGDANRMARLVAGPAPPLYVGAALLGTARAAGCAGAILALAGLSPRLCLDVWEGDAERVPDLLALHVEASEAFPQGLKALLAARHGTSCVTRWSAAG